MSHFTRLVSTSFKSSYFWDKVLLIHPRRFDCNGTEINKHTCTDTGCPVNNGVFLPLVNRNNSEYLNELRVKKQSLGMELLFHQQENAKITTEIQNSDLFSKAQIHSSPKVAHCSANGCFTNICCSFLNNLS